MNSSALTEKRREKVIGLLKGMNIKKGDDGNFDKENVYECMQQLCDLYEDSIEELQNAYETELGELRDKYHKYDENNDLYISLIMEAKKSSNEIINQAKNEVETILSEGRDKIAAQEEEIKLMNEGLEQEKTLLNEELMAARQAVEAEKLALIAEVEAEKEKASALKQKYNRQMLSMDEEFMDIKTNILRTAGKIDAIKAKLNADELYSWDVSYEEESVTIPEPEEGIEGIIPAEDVEVAEEAVSEVEEVSYEEPEIEEYEPLENIHSIEDLIGELEDVAAEQAADAAEESEIPEGEINFDDIDFTSLSDEDPQEEISFEGLESLFKE